MTDKDKLIHKIMSLKKPTISLQTAMDIVDAIIDDGVIVPPCKVGDWLWVVRKDYVSQCFRVDGFDDKNLVMYMQDNEHNFSLIYKGIKIWRVSFDDFGKTVFLTKEEAETQLRELKKCK